MCVIAGGASTETIMSTPPLRDTAHRAMREVVAAGNADLAAAGQTARIDGDDLCHRYLTMTAGMGPYRPSTVLDFIEGRAMEVEAMFETPVRRAAELGVETPTMAMLASLVRRLDHRA